MRASRYNNKKGGFAVQSIRTVSILGDSISTYRGASNDSNANETTRYNPYFYKAPFPLEKTYWMLLIKSLSLMLCVNNSWSGGNLSGRNNPDAGVNRAYHLAQNNGNKPDLIILFMGINDLGRKVDPAIFAADYQKTLAILCETYPNAFVCCVNLPNRDPIMKAQTELFNEIIEKSVTQAGKTFFIADLFHSELQNERYYNNTVDGLHPDEDGMKIIADVIRDAITKYFHK